MRASVQKIHHDHYDYNFNHDHMLKFYCDFLDYHVRVHKMHQDHWYDNDQHDSYT